MQLWKTESHCMLSFSTDFVWSVDVSYRNDFSTRRCLPVWSAWYCVCDLLAETDPGLEWQSYECGVELKNKLSKATVTTLMTKWNTPAFRKTKKRRRSLNFITWNGGIRWVVSWSKCYDNNWGVHWHSIRIASQSAVPPDIIQLTPKGNVNQTTTNAVKFRVNRCLTWRATRSCKHKHKETAVPPPGLQ